MSVLRSWEEVRLSWVTDISLLRSWLRRDAWLRYRYVAPTELEEGLVVKEATLAEPEAVTINYFVSKIFW